MIFRRWFQHLGVNFGEREEEKSSRGGILDIRPVSVGSLNEPISVLGQLLHSALGDEEHSSKDQQNSENKESNLSKRERKKEHQYEVIAREERRRRRKKERMISHTFMGSIVAKSS